MASFCGILCGGWVGIDVYRSQDVETLERYKGQSSVEWNILVTSHKEMDIVNRGGKHDGLHSTVFPSLSCAAALVAFYAIV